MDLFSSFNPQCSVIGLEAPFLWVSAISCLILIPQAYWLTRGQFISAFSLISSALSFELSAVFGVYSIPGSQLFFISLFFMIICCNFTGLVPYVFTPTSHLSMTLALSLPVWLGYMVMSLVFQFNSVMAHLVPSGTPGPLMPVMVLIETISSIIRPGTLAVRLAANMVAGHLLLTLLGSQGAGMSMGMLMLLIGAVVLLMMLECAVACIQAYVFTILSSLYFSEVMSPSAMVK